MKFNQDLTDVVNNCLDNNLIPMLLGEPGIGKSSWLEALAVSRHTKCFTLACNQLADKADLTGARLVPIPDENGNIVDYKQVFYPHSVIHDAIEYALENPRETPILFLDELNRTTPDVTSEALSIPTMRSIGNKKLPLNLKVVIAGNNKGNVTSLDSASVSRFVLLNVDPDTETFLGLDQNLNPFVRKVLEQHPECIFCKTITIADNSKKDDDDGSDSDLNIEDIIDDGEEMSQLTTPRTISGVSRWLNSCQQTTLLSWLNNVHQRDGEEVSLLQEILEGFTGKTNFTLFLLAEIASGIMSVASPAAQVNVGKPSCYDNFKACSDLTSLNDFISNMSQNEKSGTLLYLLFEKTDNNAYIRALAPNIDTITPSDMKVLMKLSATDKLDAENVRSLITSGTPIASTLDVILSVND